MKYMNKLTSAIRHSDNKYWVPSEGLNDASSGNCKNNNTGAKRLSERLLEQKMRNNNAAVGRRGDTT